MPRFRYTAEQVEFLTARQQTRLSELTEEFNTRFGTDKTPRTLHSFFGNHGIKRVRKGPGKGNGKPLSYTPEEHAWLMANYIGRGHAELAAGLNARFGTSKTTEQIKTFLGNRHLNTGRTGCFEKGSKPWNDGTKGRGLTGPNSGSFKKGQLPHNHQPLYSERICSKDGYIYISVPEPNPYTGFHTCYRQKHVWLWEQANGPVPKGHAIMFIDGDILNLAPENLLCVHRKVLLNLNLRDYKNQPAELKPSILALAQLEAKAGIRTVRAPSAYHKRGK